MPVSHHSTQQRMYLRPLFQFRTQSFALSLARPNSFEAQTRHKQVLLRKSRQPKSEFAPYFPPFNLCTPSQVLFTLGSCHKSSCIKLLLFLQGSTNNERSKETKCPQNSWAIHVDRPRRSTSAYRRLISRARLEAPYAIFRPRRSTRYILGSPPRLGCLYSSCAHASCITVDFIT